MVASRRDDGRPETSVAYAARRLKTAIADGTIAPGDRLSPHLLAPEFGLSHIPIREALISLTAAGYVIHKQGKGFFARLLTSDDLIDIYHWRELLEREAYRLAVPLITDEDLAEMAEVNERLRALTSRSDRLDYLELNREFHFVVFRRAGSRRLMRFLNYLWDSNQPYASLELNDSVKSFEEHLTFMPILATRDVDAVIAAADAHRQSGIDRVKQWEASQHPDAATG